LKNSPDPELLSKREFRINIATLHLFSVRFMSAYGNRLTGILLAGGMSKRMGREKGNIHIHNAKLFEYPLSVLETTCDEILISTCQEKRFYFEHQSICDEIKGIGPMGGIYTCLKESSNDLNLVLSYDMPLVNQELISYLLGEWQKEEVLLPALEEGRPQPLCGLYRKQVTGALEDLILQKEYAVHNILSKTHSRILKIPEKFEWWDPELFLSINREEDLQKLPSGISLKRHEK